MMITFLAFSFRSYFSSPSLWLNTSQLWEWNFKQSLGWERYVSFQDRDTITMQSVDACWGGQRSQTDHRYNKYRTRQSRRPAVSHCHFLWHVDEVLLSLISRSWSGLYGDKLVLTHKNTQTHSFQDSLRAISWAMQFVESAGGRGGGDCQTGWAGSSWSRPLCPRLSFSVHLHWLPTCLFSQRALWKDRNVMLLLKHNLWWSLYAVPMLYLQSMSTPSTHPPNASSQRLQAPGSV